MRARKDPDRAAPEEAPSWPLEPRRFRFHTRLWLPCTNQALASGLREVLAMARRCRCPEGPRTDLEIAAREALANAMIHGNATSPKKKVFIGCYGDPDSGILLVVRDQGGGFDPNALPDPRSTDRRHLHHGRGVFLMQKLMDHVEYRKGGREVLLFKACRTGGSSDGAAPRGRRRSP